MDRIEQVSKVYDKSTCNTARQIGNVLGVSRNAVIGWYTRNPELARRFPLLGAKPGQIKRGRREKREGIDTVARRARIEGDHKGIKPPKPVPVPAIPDVGRYILEDLPHDGCKWPVGDGPFLFCGEVRDWLNKIPYCPAHQERSINPYVRLRGRTRS